MMIFSHHNEQFFANIWEDLDCIGDCSKAKKEVLLNLALASMDLVYITKTNCVAKEIQAGKVLE